MEFVLLSLIAVALLVLIVWLYSFKQELGAKPAIDPAMFVLLQQRVDVLGQELKGSLQENVRSQQQSSHHMTSTVRDVTERLVRLEETNKQILSFSSQLDRLQKMLSNPKQRGILGEYYLETLLKNLFSPEQYAMQYKFQDGQIVDAAVFVKDKIVPIDSKFSLENYNRLAEEESSEERSRLEKLFLNDLKLRIKETSKYIRPKEQTTDFAFMFIPHEAIYYDLLVNKIGGMNDDDENLLQRAASSYHVIIVSPTSFSAYLQTVLQGLNALKIEEQAKEIRERVGDLGRHISNYEQCFQKLGTHLGTAVGQYNAAHKELQKIDKDVTRITGQGIGVQLVALARPNEDDV